jgi:hypothetical protein
MRAQKKPAIPVNILITGSSLIEGVFSEFKGCSPQTVSVDPGWCLPFKGIAQELLMF